jgi:hypothetical protein
MKRLVAVCAGILGAVSLALAPAQAVTPLVVVGAGNGAVIRFEGAHKASVTKGTLVLVSAVTDGVAIVNLKPRLVACQHPYRAPFVDAGAYTRTTAAAGREFRILQFHVKTASGAYKAGSTYTFIEDIAQGVSGVDRNCGFRPISFSAADIAKAESPNGFLWLPPAVI